MSLSFEFLALGMIRSFEYISPVVLEGKVVAVISAGERLDPFFYQSNYFRKLLRYFTLGLLALVMIGTLLIIRNITKGVDPLKAGLTAHGKGYPSFIA